MTEDELRKIAEEATPGRWWVGDPQPFVPGAQIRIYHESGSPIRISGSDARHVWVSPDGAFIATFNPATVLALLDRVEKAERALQRVRELHQPGNIIDVWGKSNSQDDDFQVCVECSDVDNWWVEYPCPTIRALEGDE